MTYYSDWYAATQPATAMDAIQPKVSGAVNNRFYKRAYAVLSTAFLSGTSIQCRMMTLKKTDRLSALFLSTSGASTTCAADVGLYQAGTSHDGAVIDADEFEAASALTTAKNRVESLLAAGTTAITRRGAPLWEIAGYASADVAPEEIDIVLTCTTDHTGTNEPVVLEVEGYFS